MKKFYLSILSILFFTYLTLFFINLFYINKNNVLVELIQSDETIDTRHPYLILRELEKKQTSIEMPHPVQYLYNKRSLKFDFFPLSSHSNILSLMCNENGYWKYFVTDKYGFNNKNEDYNKIKNGLNNILMIGDSFAEGYCVKDRYHFKNNLEKAGFDVLNLAKGGSGPLMELGALKEYFNVGNFNYVLWFYYPNDLIDILEESKNKLLMKYLQNDFSQGLMNKQEKVNEFYKNESASYKRYNDFKKYYLSQNRLEEGFKELETQNYFLDKLNLKKIHNLKDYFFLNLVLKEVNSRLSFILNKTNRNKDYKLVKQVIKEAINFVEDKNAKFVFVYLPSRSEILEKKEADSEIIDFVESLNKSIINLNPIIIKNFNYGDIYKFSLPYSHYNEFTFQKFSNEIVDFLKKGDLAKQKFN